MDAATTRSETRVPRVLPAFPASPASASPRGGGASLGGGLAALLAVLLAVPILALSLLLAIGVVAIAAVALLAAAVWRRLSGLPDRLRRGGPEAERVNVRVIRPR